MDYIIKNAYNNKKINHQKVLRELCTFYELI